MTATDSKPAPWVAAGDEPTSIWAIVHFRRVRRVSRRLALTGALAAVIISLLTLFSRTCALPSLATLGVVGASLSWPETLGLLATGLSLLLAVPEAFRPTQRGHGRSRRWRWVALGTGGLAVAGGLWGLVQFPAHAGYLALGPSLLLILLGFSAVCWRSRALFRMTQSVVIVAGLGAWFLLLHGAFATAPRGGGLPPTLTFAPVLTLLLSAGLLVLRPFEGWMRLAITTHLAGRLLRRLLPVALALPLAIALIRLVLERHLPLPTGPVLAVVTMILVSSLVWVALANALAIDVLGRQRRRLELRAARNLHEANCAMAQAQVFFEAAPASMFVVGEAGRIRAVNGEAERLFGWLRTELAGRGLLDIAAIEEAAAWTRWFAESRHQAEGRPVQELSCRRRDGSVFPVEVGLRRSSADERLYVVHVRDLSARKRFEQELARREHRLLEAQRLGRLGYWDWEVESGQVTWSEGVRQIMGFPGDQPMPGLWEQLATYTPDSRAFLEHALKRALAEGVPYRLELTITGHDRRRRDVLATGEARLNGAGKVTGLFGALQDITDQKATRRALETVSERLRLATEAAQTGVWDWQVVSDRLVWDERSLEIHGLVPETFGGSSQDWRQLIHPQDSERLQEQLNAAFTGTTGLHAEFRIRRPDGVERNVRCDALVQKDAFGRPWRVLGTYLDVTEQREGEERLRRSERALRESEERFRLAFESAGIGMALVSPEGKWLKVNRTLCATLGYAADELMAKSSSDLTHPEDRIQDQSLVGHVLAGDLKTYQRAKRYQHAQGHVVWAMVTVALVRDPQGQPLYFVSLIEDVTQRRETERQVRTLNDQLRSILQFTPSPVLLLDRDGRYLLASRSAEDALGRPVAKIIGRRVEEVLPAGEAATFRERLERLATTGRSFVVEDVQADSQGETTRLSTMFPLLDAQGRHFASGVVAVDITEQRRARRLAEEAANEKEILVQEIHHRVKNNLQIISSLLQLEARAVQDSAARERFEDCRTRVQAMALIHERLYRAGDLSCIDLRVHLESLTGQIIRSYGRVPDQMLGAIEITVGPVGIETAVPCSLIVAELVTNAMKHAFPGQRHGQLAIRLTPLGTHWELAVSDNGVGGPAKAASMEGGSLGLKLVQALARQLQGEVVVEGTGGMMVKIRFPAPMDGKTDS